MTKLYRNTVHQPSIANIVEWFNRAKPNSTRRDAMIQMGVHFEEVSEHLERVHGTNQQGGLSTMIALDAVKRLAEDMKANPDNYEVLEDDRVKLLDALCDQIVTATGTGVFLGMNIEAAIDHVNDSNWSKFVDGQAVFTEQGKIAKGPGYFKPDLTVFV